MEFTIKKLPESQLETEIKIPSSEFQSFIDKALFQLGQDLEIKGFRKGKIPKEILEKRLGQERILKEAGESAIRESYLKVVLENKIEAIGQPEIEILSPPQMGRDLLFKVRISILPEVILPDYKKIASSCKKRKVSVEGKEIEEALSWLKLSRAKFSQVLRPAQKGDFVEIEFSSPDIEGGQKQKDAFLLAQGRLIPGFEENLEGMTTGEEKTFSLRFPDNHFQKNLANKETSFEVKMLSVQKRELPEINDQFAQSLGQFENLTALKRSINQGLNLEKEIQEKQRLRREILQKIVKEVPWELPEVLILAEKNRMLENFKQDIESKFQTNFGDYLKRVNQTEEEIKKSFSQEAENRIESFLVLNKISQIENIQVSEEEVKAEVNKTLTQYPDIKEAEKGVDLEKLKLYIESELRNEKTLEMLENLTRPENV
jgi:trigger factor